MNIDKKKILIQLLALVGLLLSIKLAHIYYVANYKVYALSSFCSINEFVDCDGAAKSTASQFLGIPLAYWGIFFYITVFFLTIVEKLKQAKFLKFLEVFRNPCSYITFLGTVAFICSMILAWKSIFVIHKLCILCLITYFIDLFIALVASVGKPKQFLLSFKDTVVDFYHGAISYKKTFVVLVLLAVSLLSYSQITYNFIPHMKKHRSIMKYYVMTYNPYRVTGNDLGAKDADVVIELYSDFVCGHCYMNNIMLHQAVKEFSNVRVEHHHFPFDKECNKYMEITAHPGACLMSRAAVAAGKQGNYWEMASMLHENQPNSMDKILMLAEKIKLNIDDFKNDINSEETKKEVLSDVEKVQELGIDATPTMFINGDKIVGIKPYYELKDILIDHGAKKSK